MISSTKCCLSWLEVVAGSRLLLWCVTMCVYDFSSCITIPQNTQAFPSLSAWLHDSWNLSLFCVCEPTHMPKLNCHPPRLVYFWCVLCVATLKSMNWPFYAVCHALTLLRLLDNSITTISQMLLKCHIGKRNCEPMPCWSHVAWWWEEWARSVERWTEWKMDWI